MNQKTQPMKQEPEVCADQRTALPEEYLKVLAALGDPDVSVTKLIGAIGTDPAFTAALLRLAGLQRSVLRDLDGRVLFVSRSSAGTLCTTLEEAIEHGVPLERVDLRGADLRGARISAPGERQWVYLDGADLSGADLRGAQIARVNLVGARLSDARMSGASLRSVNAMDAVLDRVDLSGADLRFVGMSGIRALDADFSGCFMDTVGFSEASLIRADLSRSRIAHFDHTGGFNRANLSYADLGAVQADGPVPFMQAMLLSANLSNAHLPGAAFIESTLNQCTMASADLSAARFEKASCEGVDATGADLRRASIIDVNLDRANLEGADLRGARIRRISTDRTAVAGIRLDDEDAYQFAVPSLQPYRLTDATIAGAVLFARHLRQRATHHEAFGAPAG